MLPVGHHAPKIIMVVNYCGRQLARSLGWAAPAFHERGVPPRILGQEARWELWGAGWDVEFRSSVWKGGDVCEELRKRMIDVCCLMEVRWRGQGANMLGMKGRRYKLWWSGKGD